MSTRAGLRIHVECDKRPSLLADIMKVLEARGLNVEGAGVAFEERFVLDCAGSLVHTQNHAHSIMIALYIIERCCCIAFVSVVIVLS